MIQLFRENEKQDAHRSFLKAFRSEISHSLPHVYGNYFNLFATKYVSFSVISERCTERSALSPPDSEIDQKSNRFIHSVDFIKNSRFETDRKSLDN